MAHAHIPQIHVYVEEASSGAHYLYVESLYPEGEPVVLAESVLLALLVGTSATGAELPVAPERGLPPNLSRALQQVYTLEHPRHPTWLSPAELAEVEARYHALTGEHQPRIQQLLDAMARRSKWRVVVWLATRDA